MSTDYGTFQTDRLIVEPWDRALAHPESQLPQQVASILDAEVTAFLPDHLQFDKKAHKSTDSNYVTEWCQAFDEGANVSTIWCNGDLAGLLTLSQTQPMHLGYIFGKASWGNGLATELVKGLVRNLKDKQYAGVLHAGVTHGNPASVRVLEKAGFNLLLQQDGQPLDTDFFQLRFDQ